MKIFDNPIYNASALLLSLTLLLTSCQKEFELIGEVYSQDFESEEFGAELINAKPFEFNGSTMAGNYHRGGFELHLTDIPDHNLIQVTFDLYILDSWDGNISGISGPDKWFFESKRERAFRKSSVEDFRFETTFSNTGDPNVFPCQGNFCLKQSFPDRFPDLHDPRTGSVQRLQGFCHNRDRNNGTTRYRLSFVFRHDHEEIHLFFYDELIQDNAFSKPCDESWALDNLSITTFEEI